ncbi:MAG: hypothetical protein O2820_06370 [Planctomycetota bacterium]|nr:hypothetical protein [Planctomycetota bacterium]MDA1248832.1 hypothetical protein [Planctomycetota bacterium]
MFSASSRAVSLCAIVVVAVVGSALTGAADEKKEKPLSPETILKDQFEGKATVELEVGEVHTLNIDSIFVPDVSHAQIIKAKIPGAKVGQEVLVTVSREVATRILKLGIEDPAEHFRGKILRVSGTVEPVKKLSTPSAMVYRIQVTNLDQLESIRKPSLSCRTQRWTGKADRPEIE